MTDDKQKRLPLVRPLKGGSQRTPNEHAENYLKEVSGKIYPKTSLPAKGGSQKTNTDIIEQANKKVLIVDPRES